MLDAEMMVRADDRALEKAMDALPKSDRSKYRKVVGLKVFFVLLLVIEVIVFQR